MPEQVAHIPVMRQEVLHHLAPQDGEIYVDGTFGAGGHSRAILESANCIVYALDRDPHVKPFADTLAEEFGERFHFIEGRFSQMEALLSERGVTKVDGVLLDVGVSSMQLDEADRGFSFQKDGPLDMRMAGEGPDASMLINEADEVTLADIIYQYGDERKSRRIAKAIVEARKEKPVTRTSELAAIVQKAVHRYHDAIHPATRTFQAIRIWVNEELDELMAGMRGAEAILKPGGRLVVITFHSGEDAKAKAYLRKSSGQVEGTSRHFPQVEQMKIAVTFEQRVRKAIKPSEAEIAVNPRARSSRLRVAVRTEVPFQGMVG